MALNLRLRGGESPFDLRQRDLFAGFHLGAKQRLQQLALEQRHLRFVLERGQREVAAAAKDAFALGAVDAQDASLPEIDQGGDDVALIDLFIEQRADHAGRQIVRRIRDELRHRPDLGIATPGPPGGQRRHAATDGDQAAPARGRGD